MSALATLWRAAAYGYRRSELHQAERVVVLASSRVAPDVVQAFFGAARERADDVILVTHEFRGQFQELPAQAVKAALECDFLVDLDLGASVYTESHAAIIRGRPRVLAVPFDVEPLLQCLPTDTLLARLDKACARHDRANIMRIHDDEGSDLAIARGNPAVRPTLKQGSALSDSSRRFANMCGAWTALAPPEDAAQGVLMFRGAFIAHVPTRIGYVVSRPVRMVFDKGRLVEIDGKTEAGAYLAFWFDQWEDPVARQLAHVNLGLDERATYYRITNLDLHAFAGGILLGIGINYTPLFGSTVKGNAHIDLLQVGAHYDLDDTPILRHGRFTKQSGLGGAV